MRSECRMMKRNNTDSLLSPMQFGPGSLNESIPQINFYNYAIYPF